MIAAKSILWYNDCHAQWRIFVGAALCERVCVENRGITTKPRGRRGNEHKLENISNHADLQP